MEELEEEGSGFVSDMFKLISLYYVGDDLLLACTMTEAEQKFKIITGEKKIWT